MNTSFITKFFRFRSRAPRTKRFEILLPLNYNDGTRIEPEELAQIVAELIDEFGGITQDTVRVSGTWQYGGALYRDNLLRVRIDSTDPAATAFLKGY